MRRTLASSAVDPLVLVPTSERVAPGGVAGVPRGDLVPATWRRALWRGTRARPGRALLPACERYAGVVWEALDVASLRAPARRRLAASVVVVSPTHGLLRADEPCGLDPLRYADRLDDGRLVAAYWRALLPPVVARLAEGRAVWDLLPSDHAAVARVAPGEGRYALRVERAGRVVSYDSKAVKGAVVRHFVTTGDFSAEGLRAFAHRGYSLDPGSPGLADGGGLVRMVAA
jgi:cytoplasmic iron level regulating protein YaaA (DUF328/UPF0246 family)